MKCVRVNCRYHMTGCGYESVHTDYTKEGFYGHDLFISVPKTWGQ